MKKTKLYKWVAHLFYRCSIISQEKQFQNRLKYVFKYKKNSNKLLVVFSGFPGKGKAKYNYMRTLRHVQCNQLFILDDFGYEKKGSYYLGENGNYYVEKMVTELIESLKSKYNLETLITAGSSKGGVCAIHFGLKMKADAIIAGAPQYYIGDYLKNGHEKILIGIAGNDELQTDYLNKLLSSTIHDNRESNSIIYLHYSPKEHTYEEHIQYLIKELKKNNFNIIENIGEYMNHSDVSLYFPQFLKESAKIEIIK